MLLSSPSARPDHHSKPVQTETTVTLSTSPVGLAAPIITHTAATPRGSPSPESNSPAGSRLSPKSILSTRSETPRSYDTSLQGEINTLVSLTVLSLVFFLIFRLLSHANCMLLLILQGLDTLGPPSGLLRSLSNRSCASSRSSRRSSLNPAMPTKSILSRKSSLAAPSATSGGGYITSPEDAGDTNSLLPSSPESAGLLRQGSKKLWKRLSREQSSGGTGSQQLNVENTDLIDEDSLLNPTNSGSYNRLNNLNNRQTRYNIKQSVRRSVKVINLIECILNNSDNRLICNGGTQHEGPFHQRKPVLSHQNSFGSPPTLSPQNSIRSNGSSPRSPSSFNLPGNNFNFINSSETAVASGNEATTPVKTDEEVVKKTLIIRLYERYPRLKEREDYSLFLFSPEHKYKLF